MSDFTTHHEGSIILLHPNTEAAREWMKENLPMDSPETQFWGEAIVIETRYFTAIAEGIRRDGLTLD